MVADVEVSNEPKYLELVVSEFTTKYTIVDRSLIFDFRLHHIWPYFDSLNPFLHAERHIEWTSEGLNPFHHFL
jgi:hypothetical protein